MAPVNVGDPEREIYIEPIELPVPAHEDDEPSEAPVPAEPERVLVPA